MAFSRTLRAYLVAAGPVMILLVLLLYSDRQVTGTALADEPTPVSWQFQFLRQWFNQPPLGVFNHQPTGMAFDQSSNLYVVDRDNRRVQVLDRQGQAIKAFGTLGDGPGEFWLPLNVAVDSHGTVYVTDQYANRVVRFAPDGTPLSSWDGFEAPVGIGVGTDDSIYVSDHPGLPPRDSGRLFKLSPDGSSRTLLREVLGGFGSLKVKREGGADVIYILANQRIVQKYSATGGLPLNEWGDLDLRNPFDLEVDRQGNLYVTSRDDDSLVLRSARDGTIQRWTGFLTPEGVILGPDNLLYISDGEGGNFGTGHSTQMRIQRFTGQHQLVEPTWGSEEGHAPGQLVGPDHIAWDPAGYIWVHNNAEGRFEQFTPQGDFVRETPRLAEFRSIVGIQVDHDGTLWVGSRCQISNLSLTGEVLHVYQGSDPPCITTSVNPRINFTNPRGFVFDSARNMYVADIVNRRVVKLDTSGQIVKAYGSEDTLNGPDDVALDEQRGLLYALDTQELIVNGLIRRSSRIQVFTLAEGTLEATWVVPNTNPTRPLDDADLNHIEVDSQGYVYAGNGDPEMATVWKLDPLKGDPIAGITPGGRGIKPGQFDALSRWNTFTLDPHGNLYTVELDNNRVQVFAQVASPITVTATLTTSMTTQTPSPTTSPSATLTALATATATTEPTLTAMLSPTPSTTNTATSTATVSATASTAPSRTATPTLSIASTETPSATPSASPSATTAPAATATGTATPSPSPSLSATSTLQPTTTPTSIPLARDHRLFLPYLIR